MTTPNAPAARMGEDFRPVSGATISECGRYRYRLWRQWDDLAPVMVFCMMNPSTADASQDDATIRRCIGFAKRERHGGIIVVNVFALRATNPGELLTADDPYGPENEAHLLCARSPILSTLVVAWGVPVGGRRLRHHYTRAAVTLLPLKPKCLGTTSAGWPKHPLYLRADAPLVDWRMP